MPRKKIERELAIKLGTRSLVLVGLMGAGKTTVGRRLSVRLGLPFVDADAEIEAAAGKSISDIFAEHGEAHFREGERKVICRLLREGPLVLATGGGAFMNDVTRQAIAEAGISIWLKADLDTLMRRVRRRDHRPLLKQPDPEAVMRDLMEKRYPVYANANLTVDTHDAPHQTIVEDIVACLRLYLEQPAASAPAPNQNDQAERP